MTFDTQMAGAKIAGRVAAAPAAIVDAVREAAGRTGTDFSFLLAQARVESGLDAGARAATSSARGLFQFTKATWLETVEKHGSAHGMGWAAEMLKSGAASAGSAARETILALRDHPVAASLMAGALVRDNAAALEARLGRATGATDLYLAHFLGAGGAGRFLSAMAADPGRAAADVVPAAAAANRAIFYGRDGSALSLAAVQAKLAGRLARAGADLAAGGEVLPGGGEGLPVAAVFGPRVEPGATEGVGLGGAVGVAAAGGWPGGGEGVLARAVLRPRVEPGATEGGGSSASAAAAASAAGRARMAYMLLAELGG